jgi:spore coat polysaccharide biosynthesis predicted glycosyltransferase SpsG
VKENPNMLDIRRKSFYKKIAQIPNVVLVSNSFDSASLIQKSNGVISSSGTALLEAELLNIPGLCLGEAEFKDYISHTGFDSVSNFMNLFEQGKEKYTSRVNQYIEFLKKYSIQIGLFRSYTPNDLDASEIVGLANAIRAFLGIK